jgi:catechol 2,3-dioxygenase-like lactoylglutathione lyase family enzyme
MYWEGYMIKKVRHTGIVVRDLQKTANFYQALGFVTDNSAIETGRFIDQVTNLENVKLEWIKLKSKDGYVLELLQYHSHPQQKKISKQDSNQLGCSHLAFTVNNADEVCHKIKDLGGSVKNLAVLTPDKKVKVAYCHDIEGNLMEIVEII